MAFVLRVTQGAGEGESHTFEAEARLGRTADNDLVIKDPSSSRSHARVFEKSGRYFVEDLKSQNGTTLNKVVLKAPRPLKDGDEIAIGDVVLEFSLAEVDVAEADTGEGVDSDTLRAATQETANDIEPVPDDDPNATLHQAPPPRRSLPERSVARRAPVRRPTPAPADSEPEAEEPSGESAVEVRRPRPPPPQRRAAAPRPARFESDPEISELTAADVARERRHLEKSTVGRVQLLWKRMSTPVRVIVSIMLVALGAGMLGGLGYAMWPRRVQNKIEPNDLRANGDPIPESFGSGDDVDFERPDMKGFSFTYNSPTRVVGVLHYQARGISKGEVSIELNGTELTTIPPDLLDTDTREQDAVLPASAVKLGEPNELVFDNVNNPPNSDDWRIWNIWVELIPTPEMNAEEASRRAKEDIDRAGKYYELRDVGAENLFRAWKTYRDAWLLLEATPDRPDSLHQITRTRMREIRPELDRKCSAMMVEYKKVMNLKLPDTLQARKLLEDIPTYFPTREHPCHNLSRSLLRDLEDLQVAPAP